MSKGQRHDIVFDDEVYGEQGQGEDGRSRTVSRDLSAKTRLTRGGEGAGAGGTGERKATAVQTQDNSVVEEDFYQRRQPRLEAAAARYQDYFGRGDREQSQSLVKSTLLREPNFPGLTDACIMPRTRLPHETVTYCDGTYFGQTRANMPTGYGMFWFNSGDVFIGKWVSGVPEGHGYYYMVEGGLFFGQISNGFANGFGIYARPQDQLYYQGNFDAGYLDGKGFLHSKGQGFSCIAKTNRITFTKRKDMQSNKRIEFPTKLSSIEDEMAFLALIHNPEWRNQFVQAASSSAWQNIYFGEKNNNGQMHGIGTLLRADGSRFHGIFVEDKPSGFGVTVDKELSIHIGFFSQEGPSLFGSRSQPMQGSLFCGGWGRGLFEGPGFFHLAQQNRWMMGFFERGNLISKSYTSESPPEEGLMSWGHDLQVSLLQKAFGLGGKALEKRLGCLVLSGRCSDNCNMTAAASGNNQAVKIENNYLRRVWKKYLEGTEVARPKRFTGEDWGSRSKSPINTKDMHKEVLKSFLKPEPQKSATQDGDSFSFRENQKTDNPRLSNLRDTDSKENEPISQFEQHARPRGHTFGDSETKRMQPIDPMRQLDSNRNDNNGPGSPEFKKPDFAFLNDL